MKNIRYFTYSEMVQISIIGIIYRAVPGCEYLHKYEPSRKKNRSRWSYNLDWVRHDPAGQKIGWRVDSNWIVSPFYAVFAGTGKNPVLTEISEKDVFIKML